MTLATKRLTLFLLIVVFNTSFGALPDSPHLPNIELDYLKEIHTQSPEVDPSLTSLLMATLLNAKQQEKGIKFFEELIAKNLTDTKSKQYAINLSSLAVLRTSNAENIFLLKRKKWVRETIKMFNKAREIQPDNFLVRWMSGTVLAQLPPQFEQVDQAKTDLEWLLSRVEQIPRDGLLAGTQREVYYQLARIYQQEGEKEKSQALLSKSGYQQFERKSTFITQFAVDANNGLTLASPEIKVIVPGKVYALSGYEMTEYYFIVTEDGKELISIDAGTRPEMAKRAHQALMSKYPNLPPVTTVLVTHAHWDHIGGHQYFRSINKNVKFISSAHYKKTLHNVKEPDPYFKYFFSKHFSTKFVMNYKPDKTIDSRTNMIIGGTYIELIPISGAETEDGLFINLPKYRLTFVGDFMMPYMGAPFINEGNPRGLLESIDILVSLKSNRQLHGHKPLTIIFSPIKTIAQLKPALEELMNLTFKANLKGLSRSEIQQLNLIPNAIFNNVSLQLPYMILRDGIISRLHHQLNGYWQHNLEGMDYLSHKDIGFLLADKLEISESFAATTLEKLIDDAEYDSALKLSNWFTKVYPSSNRIQSARRDALRGLKEKYQYSNPFKFVIYSEALGVGLPQLGK